MSGRSLVFEALLVTSLLLLGVFVGSFASRHYSGQPLFYQGELGPAVMIAAGRGFVNPVVTPGTPLAEFLALRRPALDPGAALSVGIMPTDQFQEATRYLMLAVGYGWRMSGISWAAVSSVGAILYALSIVAGYAICRVFLSRMLAALGAVFLCFSPLHLEQVPHLRDYSKAPFILFALLLVVMVSLRPLSRRMLVLLAGICGVVIGIGLGFKMDVFVMAPIFLASLFAFRDRRPWTGLVEKGLAAGVFVVSLLIAAAPVLSHLSAGGSNGFHVILLGYADQFDGFLGVNRSVYSFLPFYSDGYLVTVVRAFDLKGSTGQPLPVPSQAYDAASRAYWFEIVRHFPADILTRALAAANGVLNAPFNEPALNFLTASADRSNPLWNLLTNQVPHRARIGAVFEWLSMLNGWGVILGALLVGAGSVRSARLGIFAAWILLALTGYSSLQFAGRHFFHLEIIPVLGVLVAIHLVVRKRPPSLRATIRFATAVVVLAVATAASVAVLRAYQTAHLHRVFQQYVDSPSQSVQPVVTPTDTGTWRVQWGAMSAPLRTTGPLTADYYVVEFDGPPQPQISMLGLRYRSAPGAPDFSRVVSMSEEPGVNRVFLPAFGEPAVFEFDGLELPAGIKNRLRGVYRVAHPEELPLLLDVRLPGGWRQEALNQTWRVEGGGIADDIQLLGSIAGTAVSRMALIGRVDSADAVPSPDAVAGAYTNAVRVTARGVEMDGIADTQSSYLLQFKPVNVQAPAVLIVRGHLYAGGVAFGLLKDNHWYRNLSAGIPGDFVAIVDIPDSGTYVPIVTNSTARDHDRNRFVLSRFGIVTTNPARP